MTFFAEERAVSPVLGGILMFGLAMSLLILTQVSVVPAANQQLEFEHNQGVQKDFERFGSSTTRVAGSGATETVDVDLGVRYPNRFFLVNPGPASGSLSTDAATFAIENVTSTTPETAEYYDSLGNDVTYQTTRLVYDPTYRQYANAPRTFYENGVVFNEYDGDVTLVTSRTPIVSDGDITLVLFDGNVQEQTTGTTSLTLQAASAPAKRIAVTDDGEPITLRIATLVPESDWQEYADGESAVTLHTYVDADADPRTPNEVVLRLDDTRDYTLRVARVTLNGNAITDLPAYVTTVGSYASSVPANTSMTYTAEVRDAQNNPISGGEVTATIDGPAKFSNGNKAINASVDEDGRASVTVTGNTDALGTITVDVGRDSDADDDLSDEDGHKYVTYSFELVTTDVTKVERDADIGNVINPGNATAGDLSLESVGADQVQFKNLGTVPKSIEQVRVNFVKADGQGSAPVYQVTSVDLTALRVAGTSTGGSFDTQYATTFTVGGNYESITNGPVVVGDGEYVTFALEFDGAKQDELSPGDFYVISIRFADGTSATYFAGVV
ncbi:Ig-like domain-containing protein [Halorubellus salinus]|uniref:Ig-like domain-containing protein n=1 Tax=Halorubellus salinus TaxID=755309 RepID=UPI001D069771|nr:Ig-like domain-containing protein [Halorubellus salinus]